MHTAERPAGPDFLANFAEQNLNSGLLENAAEFRVRAQEWERDIQTIQYLRAENENLQDRINSAGHALKGT